MGDPSGTYNKSFELDDVDLSEIGESYQIPRAELSKSHNDQSHSPKSQQYLPNGEGCGVPLAEKGLRNPTSLTTPTHTKYSIDSIPEEPEEEDYSLLSIFSRNGGVGRFDTFLRNNNQKLKNWSRVIASVLAFLAYVAYFVAVLLIKTDNELENYWCDSDGLFIIISASVFIMVLYFVKLKPFFIRKRSSFHISEGVASKLETISKFYHYKYTVPSIYMAVICGIIVFLLIDTAEERSRLISALGIFVFILFGFLFSTAPRKIVWRHVIWGMGLQFILGLMILRWPVGRKMFKCLGDKVQSFLMFTEHGSSFLFGQLVTEFHVFAFTVMSVILFFSLFVQILYYYGLMQSIVLRVGWLLQISVGPTACESVNAAANIFLGMSEAPLLIKPYLPLMTKSELHAVLTGGFATVAGSVLAAYISFGVNASHLLSASVMSAPAALAFSKLFYPEVEKSRTNAKDIQIIKGTETNVLHAALEGVSAAIPLVTNIAANLIAFIAFIAFIDAVLSWPCDLVGLAEGTCTLSNVFGYVCMPIAWIMGVPWADCYNVGQLIGTKTIINEFVAYIKLGEFIDQSALSARSVTIATYALCGFSNLSSIGIQLGALGSMAPERKGDLSKIVFRAMVSGTVACFLTACVAGTLISTDSLEDTLPEI